MANHFFISDTHFGHENIIRFTDDKGNRIRPFDSLSHMHEHMIQKWNSVVRQGDRVYVLGDVVINKALGFPVLPRLNGKKILVAGNHDPFDTLDYLEHFEKIYGVRVMKGAVFTHVPIHPHSLNDRSWKVNVHGHLHNNVVKLDNGHPDPRYINVSCEQLDYTPLALEDLRKQIWATGVDKNKYPLTFY
jgi:calcineurin-like phosphoesterase family protein